MCTCVQLCACMCPQPSPSSPRLAPACPCGAGLSSCQAPALALPEGLAASEGPGGPGGFPRRCLRVLTRATLSPAPLDVAVKQTQECKARGATSVFSSFLSEGEQSADGLHKRLQDIPAAGLQVRRGGGAGPRPQCRARPGRRGHAAPGARRHPVSSGSSSTLERFSSPGSTRGPGRRGWGGVRAAGPGGAGQRAEVSACSGPQPSGAPRRGSGKPRQSAQTSFRNIPRPGAMSPSRS